VKFLHVERLQKAAAARKPGYLEACVKKGQIVQIRGSPFVQMADEDYRAIAEEFAVAGRGSSRAVQGFRKPSMQLGDKLHAVAGPIGRAIKWPCMKGDGTTSLKPGSPCARLRDKLNRW
jgi:hypothetical protein